MSKRILKASLPHLNWMTKLVLILAIMVMSATGALMIRLKKGPLDLGFAKERIESALSDESKGYEVKIAEAQLIWPEVAAPLLIDLKGVDILQGNQSAFAVNEFSFVLSGLGILKGKILPSQIILHNPSLRLFDADGNLNNFWQDKSKVPPRVYGPIKPKDVRTSLREALAQIVDPKNAEIKTLSALKKIHIKNAVLQGSKEEGLALLNLSLQKHDLGLAGDLDITYPEKKGKVARFKSDVLYRRGEEDLTFTANLQDLHTSHIAPFMKDFDIIAKQDLFLSGDVKSAFDKDLKLQLATLSLNMPEGKFVVPDVYDEPVPLKDVVFDAQLNRPDNILDVKNFAANIGDISVIATTKAHIEGGNISAPINLKIPELRLDNIAPIFPKSHLDSPAGQWLTQKLSKGRLYDIVLNTDFYVLRDAETKARDAKMVNTKVTFKGEGMTVKYSPTLKPVTDVIAEGSYENDTLTVHGKSGNVGGVVGRNVTLKITNLSVKGGGLADIKLEASGPLKSALDYVSDKPISVGNDLGFDVKNVQGNVDFNLQLNFPTIKGLPKEKVKVKLKGVANNIVLPNVVRGLSLTGGPYDLGFDKGAITLKGKGKLDGRDIDLDWFQYFDSTGRDFESKIQAKIIADAGLRKTFGIGLTDYLTGPLPVDVAYLDKGRTAGIDVVGDLTPATLRIDSFNYQKPAGIAGKITLKAHMNGEDLKEVDKLKIDTKGFSVSNGRLIFKEFQGRGTDISRGNIPAVTLGKTRAAVDFEVTNDNVVKAVVKGSVVDMAPFIGSDQKVKRQAKPSPDGQPMNISLTANKMLGHKGEAISNAKLYLELNKASEPTRIEMDAKVGGGVMNLRFRPDSAGVRNFRMESTDAGYTLKAFGIYDKMRGGEIYITGQPRRGTIRGNLFGTAQINNFTIKGAPALAKLMSAMSVKGADGLLNSNGVSFTKLKSNFEWKFKDDGNLLVVKNGRTSGNELGLTFEGLVNMGSQTTDISGTVIPLSSVNKAIGKIPLIGEILTGGDALFAATYSMKGASSDPKISVNPLSVLAPGFVRKILFEDDVDQKVKKEEKK